VFGSDGSPIVQYIVIFAVIFTALAAIVFTVRRLTGRSLALPGRSGSRGRQPRLGIVDVYELDRARQLILLRRDNVEHLLLVGGPNDVVVERNIQRGQRPLPEATLRPEPSTEPLPDPLAEAGRLPEPPRAIAEGMPRRAEPAFEMPVVVPAPVPGSQATPAVRLPLDAALIGGDEPGRDIPVPPQTAAQAIPQAPARTRPLRTTLPPLDRQPTPERATETARPDEPAFVLPPLSAPPIEPRPVDPAILSDMARQLQAAIARPTSAAPPPPAAVTAPPAEPVPPAPAPAPVRPAPAVPAPAAPVPTVETAAPVMAPPIPAPLVAPPPAPVTTAPPRPAPAPRSPEPQLPPALDIPALVAPPPPAPAPARPAPPPPDRPRPIPPPRTEPVPPKAEPKTPGSPFSVEEIEAEFARLLGRPLDKR